MSNKLIVKQHAPGRTRVVLVVAVVLGLAVLWGLFEWGRQAGGYDRFDAARQRAGLRAQISRLEAENDRLARELAVLQTAGKVEQQAYGQVSDDLDELQSQIAELNKELSFYRGIMSPADGSTGLQIQAVQLFDNGDKGRYQLKLVLIQAGSQDRRVKGNVGVTLLGPDGSGEGEERVNLADVASDDADMRYSFRYFQVLERDFTLPDDFRPAQIEVNLKPSSKGDAVVAAYPWRLADS